MGLGSKAPLYCERSLVNGARDEASHVLLLAEDVRKRRGERGRRLHRGKHDLADVAAAIKAEDPLHLIERHVLHDVDHVLVELAADGTKVREDEGLLHVESQSDDVLGVLHREPLRVGQLEIFPEELFVVGQLDDERYVERLLQPLGEQERDQVTEVKASRRAAPSVQVEWLALLGKVVFVQVLYVLQVNVPLN